MGATTVIPTGATVSGAPRQAAPKPKCRHCGAPLIDQRMIQSGFCCAGCSYVYRLVHEQGFDAYYTLKDQVTAPADRSVFEVRDYDWLESAQRDAEAKGGVPELVVGIQGVSCAGCVWLIQRVFQHEPGARDVFVNAQHGTIRLRWVPGEFSASAFARRLQAFGYLVGQPGKQSDEPESRALTRRIGLTAAFALNVMLFTLPAYFGMQPSFEWSRLFGVLSMLFATLSMLVGGTYFIGRAVRALQQRAMHIDLPIALGIVGAYAGSLYGWFSGEPRFVYFDFVATFIVLMLVGRWAQTAAVERNRRLLLRHQPNLQRVRLSGGGDADTAELQPGQSILIGPGQVVPVEARLESESMMCSLASISGEAEPRKFDAGARIPSGTVNVGHGEVRLNVVQRWSDSLLSELTAAGERLGAPYPWLEKIVRGYVIAILGVAALTGTAWWLLTGDWVRAGAAVTAVLVVSCPCAIGLAFPLADEIATVALRRRGVFVREADLWPRLKRVRKLVFDKTGTLTLEVPVLLNPDALRELEPAARAALSALVQGNTHPVSECLRQELLATAAAEPLAGDVVEHIGDGVELGGWSLGRPGWRVLIPGDTPAGAGCTVLARNSEAVAVFRFADEPRPDAAHEIERLRRSGLDVFILSGDRPEKVTALAGELGLPPRNAVGAMSPRAKAAWLDENAADDALMLGDGANDSLAFDRALCRGTPVIHRGLLARKADFYYLGRGIGGVRALFEADAHRRRTHVMILGLSVAYNVIAVGFAVVGWMSPLVAAILMPANSLLTLLLVTAGMRPVFRR